MFEVEYRQHMFLLVMTMCWLCPPALILYTLLYTSIHDISMNNIPSMYMFDFILHKQKYFEFFNIKKQSEIVRESLMLMESLVKSLLVVLLLTL